MISAKTVFLLGGGAFLTGSAQGLWNTNDVTFYTWNVNWRSNIYTLTDVTPMTPLNSTEVWDGMEGIFTWVRRWATTWYLDRICPCHWGCGRYCPWCIHDTREPFWYPKNRVGRAGGVTPIDGVEQEAAIEPVPASVHGMNPIYDCTDHLEHELDVQPYPAIPDRDHWEVTTTTDFYAQLIYANDSRRIESYNFDFYYNIGHWRPRIEAYAYNFDTDGFTYDLEGWADGVRIVPAGVLWQQVFWGFTYTNTFSWGGIEDLLYNVYREDLFVPKNQNIEIVRSLFTQAIEGTVIGDQTMSRADGKDAMTWKFVVNRTGWWVTVHSDDNQGWNYYYPRVNEILCGPPMTRPMCRSHEQGGRMVQRFQGKFRAEVAPMVNRTIYATDKEWNRQYIRHHERFVPGGPRAHVIRIARQGRDFMLHPENANLNFKLY